jgi:peptide-methionine (S)-S-oxide reductase
MNGWRPVSGSRDCYLKPGFPSAYAHHIEVPNNPTRSIKERIAMAENQHLATATLGGGCFWCTEAVFQNLRGVTQVQSGYAGGHVENPTYEQVCTARTGHAEVVQITYDPAVISYRDLLEVFFTTHDPTTPNRQGNDVGPQYRSVIFYHDAEQERIARDVIKSVNERRIWNRAIVTEVSPLPTFYPAEAYHDDYFARNPGQPYCQVIIEPKVAKLRKQHLDKLKA